jgi:CRP/FNR family transcriptional regulator
MSSFEKCQTDCRSCQSIALSVFCTLKPQELEDLNEHKLSLEVPKGSVVFYENNMPTGLYCVHQGAVKLYNTSSAGDIQISRLAKNADIIGYRSLLAGEPYKGTAETIQDSIICFIPKSSMFSLISSNLEFSLKMMEAMAKELHRAEQKSLNILFKSTRERLAEAVLLLHQTFGVDSRGFIHIKLTRTELAAITGMVHETVVRILTEWEKDEILELDKKLIKIKNMKQLLDIANLED